MQFLILFLISTMVYAKEIALTFDDAPVGSTLHFSSEERTEAFIRKLQESKSPGVMVFANPCKRSNEKSVLAQLKKYREAGHLIGNHTCSHPRLDDVGFNSFSEDARKADALLEPLFVGQNFFRFPFLNEGKKPEIRDQMRIDLPPKKRTRVSCGFRQFLVVVRSHVFDRGVESA